MAILIGISVRPAGEKDAIQELSASHISVDEGLRGDKRSRPGRRQITLMSRQVWEQTCNELDVSLHWITRRANLLVDHLELAQTQGQQIRIGEVVLEITGETDPCQKMEQAQNGLLQALTPDWRGGVTCKVLEGGDIRTGMTVELVD